MSMTRKEFLATLAGAAGIATLATACGGGGGTADSATVGNCLQNGTNVTIGTNHGHVLVVSQADVAAGVDKTYDIMGTALHTHSVMVTAALFAKLATNMAISVTSSTTDAHNHSITVVCA
jgi:hypothetical protein